MGSIANPSPSTLLPGMPTIFVSSPENLWENNNAKWFSNMIYHIMYSSNPGGVRSEYSPRQNQGAI